MDGWDVISRDDPYGQTHVQDAVRKELDAIPNVDPVLSGLAMELARQVDAGRAVAGASRELRLCMNALRGGDSAQHAGDDVDELQARREARRRANG